MSEESPTIGTRLLYAVIGAILGAILGYTATEYITTLDPVMAAAGGAGGFFLLGLVAPSVVELLAQLS